MCTCHRLPWAGSTKLERNSEAAQSFQSRHTQYGSFGVGKLRQVRPACSHPAVCSNTKRNLVTSILNPNNNPNKTENLLSLQI